MTSARNVRRAWRPGITYKYTSAHPSIIITHGENYPDNIFSRARHTNKPNTHIYRRADRAHRGFAGGLFFINSKQKPASHILFCGMTVRKYPPPPLNRPLPPMGTQVAKPPRYYRPVHACCEMETRRREEEDNRNVGVETRF